MTKQTAVDTTDEVEEAFSGDEALTSEQIVAIKKKSVSGVVSYLGRTLFLQAVGLAAASILSLTFEAEDFGIYGIVIQIIGLLTFFSDIGLAAALIQKKAAPTLTEYRTVFTVQQLLSWFIFGIAFLIAASGILQTRTGPAGNWILLALAISFPLASLKTISSIRLERKLSFSTLVIPNIIEQIVFNGILIFLAWNGMGAMAYTYAIFFRSILGTIVMFWLEPWPIGFSLNIPALKSLLVYGVKFQANDFLARIKDNLFFLVLGFMLPIQQFGYIQWAKMWSMYPYNLTVQSIMAITFPTFSRLQKNKEELARAIESSLFFISTCIFPILVGMSVFLSPLLQVIPRLEKWEPTVFTFILFTIGIGWAAISTPLINTLNAIGHINTSLKLMIFWTALTWILTPLCIYFFGFNGVAISSFAIACTSYISVYLVKQVVKINAWESVWRQLASATIMGIVGVLTLFIWGRSMIHLLSGIVLVGSVYLGSFFILGRNKLISELEYLVIVKKRK